MKLQDYAEQKLAKHMLEKENSARCIEKGKEPPDWEFRENGKKIGVEVTCLFNKYPSDFCSSSRKKHVDEEEVQRVLAGILEPCFEKFEKEYGSKILKEDVPEGFRLQVNQENFWSRSDATFKKMKESKKEIKSKVMKGLYKYFFIFDRYSDQDGIWIDTQFGDQDAQIVLDDWFSIDIDLDHWPSSDGKLFIREEDNEGKEKILPYFHIRHGDGGGIGSPVEDRFFENIKICLEQKTEKLEKHKGKYDELWLCLYDRVDNGGAIYLTKDLPELTQQKLSLLEHPWTRIILCSTVFMKPPEPDEYHTVELYNARESLPV